MLQHRCVHVTMILALTCLTFTMLSPFLAMTHFRVKPSSHPDSRTYEGTSANWCGYGVVSSLSSPSNGFVSNVSGSWTVPTLTPNSSEDTYSAVWVGIDGIFDKTVEQIGTEQDCIGGQQQNYAWIEFYPKPSQTIMYMNVNDGDNISASVSCSSSRFTLSIFDLTTGQSYSRTFSANGAQLQSAEWIVEAPSLSEILPLANFGNVNFNDAQFTDNNGTTYAIDGLGPGTYEAIAVNDPNGGTANPSTLTDDTFPEGPSSFEVNYGSVLSVGVSPVSVTIDVGQSQLFNSTVLLGEPPYSYQWYQGDVPISGANSPTWVLNATEAGSFSIHLDVTDSLGTQATSNFVNVTVNIHDLVITNIASSKTVVGQGYDLNVSLTVANLGTYQETFNLTVYGNSTYISSENVTLTSGNTTSITFTWNTTNISYGYFSITGNVSPISDETNTGKSNLTDSIIRVSIPGDINGDGKVNLTDLVLLATAYGAYPGYPRWNANADINSDGKTNIFDLTILARNYGTHVMQTS